MATSTLKLNANSYKTDSGLIVSNVGNCYTDTDSNTYGSFVHNTGSAYNAWLYFPLSSIASINADNIVEVYFKIKHAGIDPESESYIFVGFDSSDADGHWSSSDDIYVTTNTTTSTINLPDAYYDNLITAVNASNGVIYVGMDIDLQDEVRIYGAELVIVYSTNVNKVVYNGDTLIDLTNDNVSANNVISGKVFHLSSGKSAIGTKMTNLTLKTATATLSSNARNLSFNINHEPNWYIAVLNSTSSAISTPSVYFLDGVGYYCTSTSSNNKVSMTSKAGSVTYTNYTFKLSSYNSSTYYFKSGTYTLYYY